MPCPPLTVVASGSLGMLSTKYRNTRCQAPYQRAAALALLGDDGTEELLLNDEGAPIALGDNRDADLPGGDGTGRYYCGRFMGLEALPDTNGFCGPFGGDQCESCRRASGFAGVATQPVVDSPPVCEIRCRVGELPRDPASGAGPELAAKLKARRAFEDSRAAPKTNAACREARRKAGDGLREVDVPEVSSWRFVKALAESDLSSTRPRTKPSEIPRRTAKEAVWPPGVGLFLSCCNGSGCDDAHAPARFDRVEACSLLPMVSWDSKPPPCDICHEAMVWSDYRGGRYSKGWRCDNEDACQSRMSNRGPYRWFCAKCRSDVCELCHPR